MAAAKRIVIIGGRGAAAAGARRVRGGRRRQPGGQGRVRDPAALWKGQKYLTGPVKRRGGWALSPVVTNHEADVGASVIDSTNLLGTHQKILTIFKSIFFAASKKKNESFLNSLSILFYSGSRLPIFDI